MDNKPPSGGIILTPEEDAAAPQRPNGTAPQKDPGFVILSPQVIAERIKQVFEPFALALPDLRFTIVGRNMVNPGQDLVMTLDSLPEVIVTLQRYHAQRTQPTGQA